MEGTPRPDSDRRSASSSDEWKALTPSPDE
jgi:hypothetical protein